MLNPYLSLFIGFLSVLFILETVADLLNLKALQGTLPSEFQGIFESHRYETSLRYQREGTRLELLRRTIDFGLLILFLIFGGFEKVDQFARSFGGSSLLAGLIFVGILILLKGILSLPFSIYDTFSIEARYGFNKTTIKTFCIDLIRGILLTALLGGALFSGIVLFFEKVGPSSWLIAWILFSIVQLLLTYLAPVIFLPLFNRFSPLPEGPLKESIDAYMHTRQFKLSGIYTMDGSKRSTKANAFFTGFGQYKKLVLFDTLISELTPEQTVAVLAHEVGHFEHKHITQSLVLSLVSTAVLFLCFGLFVNNATVFEMFGMSSISIYAGVVFVIFIYSPCMRVVSFFTQLLSRKFEFEADAFAAKTYGKPQQLADALKKLSVNHLSHLTPHSLKVFLNYSHPPVLARIRKLREIESGLRK